MIRVTDVKKAFGSAVVLDGVSLAVNPGEVVTILGSSGSGKSTLIRCINGLEKLDGGQITVDDFDVSKPKELSEAAQIDGASEWKQFWLVQVPLARPAIMSLAILQFLWTWNQFLLPVVLVQDPLQRTMAGALGAFQGQWGTDVPLLCAGALLILAPTIAIFLIFQRQFVAALLQGAVKG